MANKKKGGASGGIKKRGRKKALLVNLKELLCKQCWEHCDNELEKQKKIISKRETELIEKKFVITGLQAEITKLQNELAIKDELLKKLEIQMHHENHDAEAQIAELKERLKKGVESKKMDSNTDVVALHQLLSSEREKTRHLEEVQAKMINMITSARNLLCPSPLLQYPTNFTSQPQFQAISPSQPQFQMNVMSQPQFQASRSGQPIILAAQPQFQTTASTDTTCGNPVVSVNSPMRGPQIASWTSVSLDEQQGDGSLSSDCGMPIAIITHVESLCTQNSLNNQVNVSETQISPSKDKELMQKIDLCPPTLSLEMPTEDRLSRESVHSVQGIVPPSLGMTAQDREKGAESLFQPPPPESVLLVANPALGEVVKGVFVAEATVYIGHGQNSDKEFQNQRSPDPENDIEHAAVAEVIKDHAYSYADKSNEVNQADCHSNEGLSSGNSACEVNAIIEVISIENLDDKVSIVATPRHMDPDDNCLINEETGIESSDVDHRDNNTHLEPSKAENSVGSFMCVVNAVESPKHIDTVIMNLRDNDCSSERSKSKRLEVSKGNEDNKGISILQLADQTDEDTSVRSSVSDVNTFESTKMIMNLRSDDYDAVSPKQLDPKKEGQSNNKKGIASHRTVDIEVENPRDGGYQVYSLRDEDLSLESSDCDTDNVTSSKIIHSDEDLLRVCNKATSYSMENSESFNHANDTQVDFQRAKNLSDESSVCATHSVTTSKKDGTGIEGHWCEDCESVHSLSSMESDDYSPSDNICGWESPRCLDAGMDIPSNKSTQLMTPRKEDPLIDPPSTASPVAKSNPAKVVAVGRPRCENIALLAKVCSFDGERLKDNRSHAQNKNCTGEILTVKPDIYISKDLEASGERNKTEDLPTLKTFIPSFNRDPDMVEDQPIIFIRTAANKDDPTPVSKTVDQGIDRDVQISKDQPIIFTRTNLVESGTTAANTDTPKPLSKKERKENLFERIKAVLKEGEDTTASQGEDTDKTVSATGTAGGGEKDKTRKFRKRKVVSMKKAVEESRVVTRSSRVKTVLFHNTFEKTPGEKGAKEIPDSLTKLQHGRKAANSPNIKYKRRVVRVTPLPLCNTDYEAMSAKANNLQPSSVTLIDSSDIASFDDKDVRHENLQTEEIIKKRKTDSDVDVLSNSCANDLPPEHFQSEEMVKKPKHTIQIVPVKFPSRNRSPTNKTLFQVSKANDKVHTPTIISNESSPVSNVHARVHTPTIFSNEPSPVVNASPTIISTKLSPVSNGNAGVHTPTINKLSPLSNAGAKIGSFTAAGIREVPSTTSIASSKVVASTLTSIREVSSPVSIASASSPMKTILRPYTYSSPCSVIKDIVSSQTCETFEGEEGTQGTSTLELPPEKQTHDDDDAPTTTIPSSRESELITDRENEEEASPIVYSMLRKEVRNEEDNCPAHGKEEDVSQYFHQSHYNSLSEGIVKCLKNVKKNYVTMVKYGVSVEKPAFMKYGKVKNENLSKTSPHVLSRSTKVRPKDAMHCSLCSPRRIPLLFNNSTELAKHIYEKHRDMEPKLVLSALEVANIKQEFQGEGELLSSPVKTSGRSTRYAKVQGSELGIDGAGVVYAENLKCQVCNKTLGSGLSLKMHMKRHEAKAIACEFPDCNKKFHVRADMLKHMRLHTGEKPYTCRYCQKAFAQMSHLNVHERTHTGVRPYECLVCSASFIQPGHLQNHMATHTGEKRFFCDVKGCRKGFYTKEKLTTHDLTHTGVKNHTCQECGMKFNHPSNFQKHLRIHAGDRRHLCPYCDKKFYTATDLRTHIRTHSGERPYMCQICYKTYITISSLRRHEVSHKNFRKVHVCEICGSEFSDEENLKRHGETHTCVTGLIGNNAKPGSDSSDCD